MIKYTDKEKIEILCDFMTKYNYTMELVDYAMDSLDYILENQVDFVSQIFSYVGVDGTDNLHSNFCKMIMKEHDIGGNILEVGGGVFPTLATYIEKEQQIIGRGSITVYDLNLVLTELGNIKLCKQMFTDETDMKAYDLIVGVAPCEATNIIVKRATNH